MIFGPADKKHPAGKYRTKRGGVLYALNIIYGGLSGDCPRTSAGKRLCPLRRYFQPYERDEAFCEPGGQGTIQKELSGEKGRWYPLPDRNRKVDCSADL